MTDTLDGPGRAREIVRRRMADQGLTHRADLARLTGLDPNTAGDFLNGKRKPSRDTLTAIERALSLARGSLTLVIQGEAPEFWPRTDRPTGQEAQLLAAEASSRLHDGLARFTDDELIGEIRARAALYASKLHTHGEPTLLHSVGRDGGDVIASRPQP